MAGARGESQLEVKGQTHNLLYTNRALIEAEQQTGKSILALFDGVRDNTLRFGELVIMLRVGLEAARRDSKAGGKPVTQEDALNISEEAGFTAVLEAVLTGMGAVLKYSGEEETGESRP